MTLSNPVVSNVLKNYQSTQNAFLPRTVSIPLVEEIDVEYKSVVKPGDKVKEGDIIAESTNLDKTTYIHSSIPGEVLDIEPSFYPNGKQGYSIKIKFGGSFSYLGKKNSEEKLTMLTGSSIERNIFEKGIVNTFNVTSPVNLGKQISDLYKNKKNNVINLIVRLFDEDSFRLTDSLVSNFHCNEIIQGAEAVAKAINAEGIVFVIDQKLKKRDVLENIQLPNFNILEMNIKRYPCGTPREIVSAFNRSGLKKTSSFQINKNDLFIDASTAYDVYKAIIKNIPSMSKFVHFSGNCLQGECMLNVKLGTSIREMVSQIGGFVKTPEIVIVNGDLCGYSIQTLDAPITKYVKSVKFISNRKFTDNQIYACVSCGNCRSVCPVNISPDILYNTTVNFQSVSESFAKSSLACISCGLCNTVCPARLPLSQTISVLKENVSNILRTK